MKFEKVKSAIELVALGLPAEFDIVGTAVKAVLFHTSPKVRIEKSGTYGEEVSVLVEVEGTKAKRRRVSAVKNIGGQKVVVENYFDDAGQSYTESAGFAKGLEADGFTVKTAQVEVLLDDAEKIIRVLNEEEAA